MLEWEYQTLLKCCNGHVTAATFRIKLIELKIAVKRFNTDQPRAPAGNSDGGRWIGNGPNPATRPRSSETDTRHPTAVGQEQRVVQDYSFGELIVEIPKKIGRDCIYKFSFGSVIVDGPTNLCCPQRVPSAAVRHGTLLNDN